MSLKQVIQAGADDIETLEENMKSYKLFTIRHAIHGFRAPVFMICFSVDNPDSLNHVETQWFAELRRVYMQKSVILVACKTDLRSDMQVKSISREEGMNIAKKLGIQYLETSSRNKEELTTCLNGALGTVVKKWFKKQKRSIRRPCSDSCCDGLILCAAFCCLPVAIIMDRINPRDDDDDDDGRCYDIL